MQNHQTSHLPPPPAPPAVVYVTAPNPTNGAAITALVLGLLTIVTFGLSSIPAVICGHIGLAKSKQPGVGGKGMAITGLVIGWSFIALWTIAVMAMASA